MKTNIAILATLASTALASANLISIDPLEGGFTDGPLASFTITGFIEVDDRGLISGTADTNPLTLGDGDFLDFMIEIETGAGIFFDLFDDLDPLATFDNGQIVGIDYVGENLDGDRLNVFYDAFATDELSGILVQYESFAGDISTGTLALPVGVPEPSTYAALLGALALGVVAWRRRR
jgi:hypothetical protein